MFVTADLTSATAFLYYLCSALSLGMALFVWAKSPHKWLHQCFGLTALSLLAWLDTLFLYERASDAQMLLLIGRANFAAVVFTAPLAWMLVRATARKSQRRRHVLLVAVETLTLVLLSVPTPLVDRVEKVNVFGQHSTVYGVLFPLYLAHVIGYLAAAIVAAFNLRSRVNDPSVRDQLLLLGSGMLATSAVAIMTNAVLPYGFGDFRWIDAGTLSTSLFLMAVAYAIVRHHLFDIRLLIRKTLVYGLLLSLALSAYSAIVLLVTDKLTAGIASASIRFGVLLIAFSFDPARRFFEHRADRFLFPDKNTNSDLPSKRKR